MNRTLVVSRCLCFKFILPLNRFVKIQWLGNDLDRRLGTILGLHRLNITKSLVRRSAFKFISLQGDTSEKKENKKKFGFLSCFFSCLFFVIFISRHLIRRQLWLGNRFNLFKI